MSDENGRCEHGVYVGGCGPDYMCGWCESGTTWQEYIEAKRFDRVRELARRRWAKFAPMLKVTDLEPTRNPKADAIIRQAVIAWFLL